MKILIIQQKMIGDVLTSSILFEALRAKYPNATLYFLINSHTYPVVENHPFIDEYILYTKQIEASKIKFIRFVKQIRAVNYDAIIDVYGSTTTALICLFGKSKMKVAYHKNYTAFVYSHTIKRLKKPLHNSSLAIENRLKLLEPLGVEFKPYTPKIYLTEQEITNAKQFLSDANINLNADLFMIGVTGVVLKKPTLLNIWRRY
ncbi:glycosyltransferase family 9 protein [Lacinutrix neustonica]|uniref:Glycosyltransferase family 9 protein n=1 Tax=Lacinutrix neustonica TaxID=2980107 RepID=A0A9E8SGM7_9FLAO|nr:glycosyltransferase family 9 protein [Lacinutrix neustonica]WAC01880.1 glycosyltransferase family 9 protein [Lacinutrix neustonica]